MIGVYKITSPSNKVYIGQSVDIEKRWLKHKTTIVKSKLYNSFVKHGFDNHIFEVIEECDVELLNERERYWQDFYNVLENGLNLKLTTTYDKSGFLHSDVKNKISKRIRTYEEIEKSRISRIGKQRTKEQKERIKKGRIYTGISEETKLKMSLIKIGKYPSKESRLKMSIAKTERSIKIILDKETGVFYNGSEDAAKYSIYSKGHINRMLTGVRKIKPI